MTKNVATNRLEPLRIAYIDIAKAIAIILVVAGHCDSKGIVDHFVNQFHMLLFVFLSGYFYKNNIITINDIGKTIKKRCKPLYLYYIKYNLLFFLFMNLFYKIGFLSNDRYYGGIISPIHSFSQFILGIIRILLLLTLSPFLYALWFIVSLILINIIYTIILYISKKQNYINPQKFILILTLICFFIGCYMNFINIYIPRFSPALTMILFFYLGHEVKKGTIKISFNNIYLFILTFSTLVILNNRGGVYMVNNHFTNPVFLLIVSFCGIYSVLFISKKIEYFLPKVTNILCYIGQRTLIILSWHYLSFKIVTLFRLIIGEVDFFSLSIIGAVNSEYTKWYLVYLIIGVSFPLLIDKIIAEAKQKSKKIIPKVMRLYNVNKLQKSKIVEID